MTTTIDPHCATCRGKGEQWCGEQREDGYWTYSVQCHCVEYHHDDEMKAFLKRAVEKANG